MTDDFDAEAEAERIAANVRRHDDELDENWCDSTFETYMERGDYTQEQAEAIAEAFIEMVYLPSSGHAANVRRAARTVEVSG